MTAFSIPIAQVAAKQKADLILAARTVIFQLFQKVVLKSPVDTGRFRANWNVSYLNPDLNVFDGVSPTRANDELAKVLTLPVDKYLWLVNNLPYALVLENGEYPNPPKGGKGKTVGGFSTQAPAGMVRISVLEIKSDIERIIAS